MPLLGHGMGEATEGGKARMKTEKTSRSFIIVEEEKYQNEPDEFTRLIQESSAYGNYKHSDIPGSSFLWIGQDHHLNREQVKELIKHLKYWLRHKRLNYKYNGEPEINENGKAD